MEKYTWSCDTDDGSPFTLILNIGKRQKRFDGEGVLQDVSLHCENTEIYETTFGREHAIKEFKDIMFDMIDLELPLNEEKFDEMMIWLLTSLTPITEQRKVKIEEIQKKMSYATI